MNIYVVSYDLMSSNDPDYEGVLQALGTCGNVNHFQKSVCLVASAMDVKMIRETVKPRLGRGDSVFVSLLTTGADGWCGWNTRLSAWISENSSL